LGILGQFKVQRKMRIHFFGKLSFQKMIDRIAGSLIGFFLIIAKRFKKRKKPEKIKKIIIFKLDALGDSILLLPILDHLKKELGCHITVVCTKINFPILSGQRFIDRFIIFKSQTIDTGFIKTLFKLFKIKADIAIDFAQSSNLSAILSFLTSEYCIGFKKERRGFARNRIYDKAIPLSHSSHMVKNYFKLIEVLGLQIPKRISLIKIKVPPQAWKKIVKIKKGSIGFHPCNIFPYREWPKEKFAKLIKYLLKQKENIVIVGSKEEKRRVSQLLKLLSEKERKKITNLTGELNIKELAALMTKLKLFIANDGGPMHLAAAMGVPTIGLFGSDTPFKYAPLGKKSIAIYKGHLFPCSPCNKPYKDQWPKCKNPKCLNQIKFSEVKRVILKILKS